MKNKYKVPKTIKARNAWFAGLTPNEKKVAIAMDVIAQLNANKYHAEEGTYFQADLSTEFTRECSMQKAMDSGKIESCSVCAIGAVFASRVRLGNEFQLTDVYADDWDVTISDGDMFRPLDGVFTKGELRMMEAFFEGRVVGDSWLISSEAAQHAADWYEYNWSESSDFKMRVIMQNIIDNDGEFVWEKMIIPEVEE